MTQSAAAGQFRDVLPSSTLVAMPLKAPLRLPKSLNRQTSIYSRRLANKRFSGSERRNRRRHERWMRTVRRMQKMANVVVSEFKVWLAIGVTVILVGSAAVLLLSPFFDVREIRVRREDPRIDVEDIQQTLSPLFRQRLLLVTKGQVSSILEAAYPDIDHVDINKEYPSTLSVSIFLQPVVAAITVDIDAAAIAQTGAVLATESGAYNYVTSGGLFVSSPIKLAAGRPIDTLHITDWSIRPQNRMPVLTPAMMKAIFAARDTLRTDFGLTISDITVFLRAEEFHIHTKKVTLWFDMQSPLSVQLQRFREFLKNASLDQAKEYIDLRIADKIIYR